MTAECGIHGTDLYWNEGDYNAPSGCTECDLSKVEARTKELEDVLAGAVANAHQCIGRSCWHHEAKRLLEGRTVAND